jgi:hypothetical protein
MSTIDILIGINYPTFHAGETKVKNGLAARKSPLGWVIFGVKSQRSPPEVKQVLHVRFAPPVDLSEFWTTESMGVSVSPCTCEAAKMSPQERTEMKIIEESCSLEDNKWTMKYPWKRDPKEWPDNYAHVVRRMESTERWLLSQPDHAESYNSQMKEMEDMTFSRKLTKKEIEEWKGPVHYISHHAVPQQLLVQRTRFVEQFIWRHPPFPREPDSYLRRYFENVSHGVDSIS